jgi:hypothetical protein
MGRLNGIESKKVTASCMKLEAVYVKYQNIGRKGPTWTPLKLFKFLLPGFLMQADIPTIHGCIVFGYSHRSQLMPEAVSNNQFHF